MEMYGEMLLWNDDGITINSYNTDRNGQRNATT